MSHRASIPKNNASKQINYSAFPPPNFSFVEETLCKCWVPISKNNISFIHSIGISGIINISGEAVDPLLVTYCEEQGISTQTALGENDEVPMFSLNEFEEWMAINLELTFSQSNSITLIIGSPNNCYDSLLVAFLRRVQEWSYVSILCEFRHNVWPNQLHDFEQLIENFDPNLVDTNAFVLPDYLAIHYNLKEEEIKLLHKCKEYEAKSSNQLPTETTADNLESNESIINNALNESNSIPAKIPTTSITIQNEQERIDKILYYLFFSEKNLLISSHTQFDPNLSLVNEKDDDD